jgi:hypothetical protein
VCAASTRVEDWHAGWGDWGGARGDNWNNRCRGRGARRGRRWGDWDRADARAARSDRGGDVGVASGCAITTLASGALDNGDNRSGLGDNGHRFHAGPGTHARHGRRRRHPFAGRGAGRGAGNADVVVVADISWAAVGVGRATNFHVTSKDWDGDGENGESGVEDHFD